MEDILKELELLFGDMRSSNIRSFGLKPVVHELWCERFEIVLAKMRDRLRTKSPVSPEQPPLASELRQQS